MPSYEITAKVRFDAPNMEEAEEAARSVGDILDPDHPHWENAQVESITVDGVHVKETDE